jgi:hypothetical protein
MNLKESLKNFFRPSWGKIILVFVLEFVITFSLLFFGDNLPDWQIYLISPNVLYLESTINPMFVLSSEVFSLHGAIANIIALVYFYFLACLIIRIHKIGRR